MPDTPNPESEEAAMLQLLAEVQFNARMFDNNIKVGAMGTPCKHLSLP